MAHKKIAYLASLDSCTPVDHVEGAVGVGDPNHEGWSFPDRERSVLKSVQVEYHGAPVSRPVDVFQNGLCFGSGFVGRRISSSVNSTQNTFFISVNFGIYTQPSQKLQSF